jgi:hypothetical protein
MIAALLTGKLGDKSERGSQVREFVDFPLSQGVLDPDMNNPWWLCNNKMPRKRFWSSRSTYKNARHPLSRWKRDTSNTAKVREQIKRMRQSLS